MKTIYNRKREQHKQQINIMESKIFELLPYTKVASEAEVTLENIFANQNSDDRAIIADLYKFI